MEFTADQVWSRILESARAQLPDQGFRTWLAPTTAVALADDVLLVSAPSDFAVEWIEDKYGPLLTRAARDLFGDGFRLAFESRANGHEGGPEIPQVPAAGLEEVPVGGSGPADAAEAPASGSGASAGCVIGALNPRYTLDRFVVGRNNQLSAAACEAVAAAPGRTYNPLFIYGGVGLGKTHLMQSIGHALLSRDPSLRVAFISTESFMNELIAAIQDRTTTRFHSRYRGIDVLLLDDVHFLADKERTQEEFYHTFNALYEAQKQIVVTSDRPPKAIPGLQERLVSRFEWGLITDVKAPDFETRVAILELKAREDGLAIGHDVLTFIATRCRSSVRELEGAIIKLLAYSSLTQRELNVGLAEEVLGTALQLEPNLTTERIVAAVAEAYGVTVADLRSKSRSRAVTTPRHVAMYLVKNILDLSYTEIGHRFGDRDHSTVIHAIRKVESEAETDTGFRKQLAELRSQLE